MDISDVTGLDSRVWAGLGLGSRVWVFTLIFITNWGSGLVRVYVEKLGSGFGL